ncbi:MAG TPA: HAMP domain-containing sensor histidine kinase, partial [Chroococcales cyanobacterium]
MNLQNLKISHKGAILVAVPLVFELVLVGWLSSALFQAKAQMDSEAQSRAVTAESAALNRSIFECATVLFALRFTSDPKMIDNFNNKMKDEQAHLKNLDELTRNNPRQSEKMNELRKASHEAAEIMDKYGRPADDSTNPRDYLIHSGAELRKMCSPVFLRLNEAVAQLNSGEKEFQDSIHQAADASWQQITVGLIVGVVFSIVSGIALAMFFTSGILRRVEALKRNAERLVSRQPLEKPVQGSDELAVLDRDLFEVATDLREAEQRKQEFTSMISHDLRTPLTSLGGTLALLDRGAYGPLNETGKARIRAALRNNSRLVALISDLLDIDMIESGNLNLDLRKTRLTDVIDAGVEMVQDLAENSQIQLEIDETTAVVHADRKRLSQVVQNLVGNAIKFSPAKSKILIKIKDRDEQVNVSVIDSGPGIKESELTEMFVRFKQTSQGREKLGTGLGLAISKAIVEGHGGQIGVNSQEGRGSTFWFSLP